MSCVLELDRRSSTRPEQQCCVDVSFLQALAEARAGLDRDELLRSTINVPPGITTLDPPDCRICLDAGDGDAALVQPCSCLGTLSFVHVGCLEEWVAAKGSLSCELCGQPYKQQVLLQMTQSTVKAAAAASKRAKAQQGAASARNQIDYVNLFKVFTWLCLAVLLGAVVIVAAVSHRNRSLTSAAAAGVSSNV